ncbi:MAG: response regulator [Cohaesibacter sp.]|nr:response regulator [Cohaesibacter sp.]MCV6600712.1 response regulator [Cohaesibacter sp.]
MEHHSAYGLDLDSLDIVIVDDSRTVLTMIRSMISSLKVARVRTFDRGDLALQAMLHEPPNVILTDLVMSPMSGTQLLHLIRQQTMVPLCFVPVIVVTAHATQKRVAQLFQSGAHHVLAKPLSAAILQQRLVSLLSDSRLMDLAGDRYIISGMRETLLEKRTKIASLEKVRQFHERIVPQAKEHQKQIDDILNHEIVPEHLIPNYYGSRSQQIVSKLHRQAAERAEAETGVSSVRVTTGTAPGRYGRISRRRMG